MEQLKFDTRLSTRRGWISREELSAALETLPDVSGKIKPAEGEAAEADEPADPEPPPVSS